MSKNTSATPAPDYDYFMRDAEVRRICPVSRVTLWRMERAGQFPKRRQISQNAIGWLASEVFGWRDQRASAALKITEQPDTPVSGAA